ncbi:MAG: anhydro-N-acetylmuramic acid kinase [Candidatus Tyrphobacter sp.]
MIAVGIMSGTSLDGVDAALVDVRPKGRTYAIDLLDFRTEPLETVLRARFVAALASGASVQERARLHRDFGVAFARVAKNVLQEKTAGYVASHGQTLYHDGDASLTLQIGDPFVVREAVRATVCYDFRSADCAAGGQGAPLVPYVDLLLFASEREDRVALNVGGIANVTLLRKRDGEAIAFDTGPGMMLVDALVCARTLGKETFDRDGAYAMRGRVDDALLRAMLADAYFSKPPPKSTGRERFGATFLQAHPALEALSLEDAAATLCELTAASVAEAIAAAGLHEPLVIVSGGGARNAGLMNRLRARLDDARVETSDRMGIDPDAKEAIAFAVLGYETLRGRAANLPSVSGARSRVALGAIAPYDLRALLERIGAECS